MEQQIAKVRCIACNAVLVAEKTLRGSACGCDNHTYVSIDRHGQVNITATDLGLVELVQGCSKPKKNANKYYVGDLPQVAKRKPTSDLSKIQIL